MFQQKYRVSIILNHGKIRDNQIENTQVDRKMSILRLKIPISAHLMIFKLYLDYSTASNDDLKCFIQRARGYCICRNITLGHIV